MYAEVDKGPQQVKIEAMLRRAFHAAKRVQPGVDFRAIKKDGVVCVGWQRILRVRAPERDSVVYEWNLVAVANLNIRKDAILADIASADSAGSSAAVEWCP